MFEDMFADDIVLQDWEIDVKGRDAVLNTMHNMFASIMCIQITPIEMYEDGQTVIAVLDIVINNNDILQVVDLICFDEKGKILSIRAYKR